MERSLTLLPITFKHVSFASLMSTCLHGGVIGEDTRDACQIFQPFVMGKVVELAAEASQLLLFLLVCQRLLPVQLFVADGYYHNQKL